LILGAGGAAIRAAYDAGDKVTRGEPTALRCELHPPKGLVTQHQVRPTWRCHAVAVASDLCVGATVTHQQPVDEDAALGLGWVRSLLDRR
jgi:hypothetical protein